MQDVIRMTDVELMGKTVLIREDLNVPLKEGVIQSDARLLAALPTIKMARSAGAKVVVMSHLGRPIEGQPDPSLSLQPVATYLSDALGDDVPLITDWQEGIDVKSGGVALLENVRFNVGEEADDDTLAKAYAALCDIFVMDAFGTAHRAQASTHGVAKYAPVACAGPLLVEELDSLGKALEAPKRPLVAIVGGSKVSTKLAVLRTLSDKVDQLVVGGGIANTFLAACGKPVGKSLYEPDLVPAAKSLMEKTTIPVPSDVVVGTEFSAEAVAEIKTTESVGVDDMIFDVGPDSVKALTDVIEQAGTIIWNGPVGVFEFDQFGAGTKAIAEAIAASDAFSIAGGGDTLAAVDKYDIADRISYISTGGGAFLEYVEGKVLPAVAMLETRAIKKTLGDIEHHYEHI